MDTDEYANKEDESIEKDKKLPSTITLKVFPEQELYHLLIFTFGVTYVKLLVGCTSVNK
ncbi:MAG: hypothetical protein N4A50_01385 [Vallitalea sp.]|jgi:hypothetical protein|nr:hypothetical protein [Vallitalea sp.]